MRTLCLLGATGSIGQSTLDVVRGHPERFRITAITGGSNLEKLVAAALEFRPAVVAVANEAALPELRTRLAKLDSTLLGGAPGIREAVARSGADLCVSAIVGAAGLIPTLDAIEAGMDIALANKETLVAAGHLVTARQRAKGVRLLPIDSEHAAIEQCLAGHKLTAVEKLIITASGGPFRDWPLERLALATAADALAHPTWQMGPKITVDSASLANKALEVIEAHWLFGVPFTKIEVVIHPQSLVHSLVHFVDGTLLAQLGTPDMRVPILHALSHPERLPYPLPRPDWRTLSGLTFHEPNCAAFPMLEIGVAAGRAGGGAPAAYSAANEAAVQGFLEGRLAFTDIPRRVEQVLDRIAPTPEPDLETILAIESEARDRVNRSLPA